MIKASEDDFELGTDELLAGIQEWVEIETPSSDAAAVNRLVSLVEQQAQLAGAVTVRHSGASGFADLLLVATPGDSQNHGVLVLSHLDTVHPVGTLKNGLPIHREGDRAFGPGIYDMKGGAFIAFAALCHLIRHGLPRKLPVRHLFVPDEEVGSPTSRAMIESEARRAKYVLVTEPARDGGKIVTSRSGGTAEFKLHIAGRAAHSLHPRSGRSAIKELARQILDLEAMNDYDAGLHVNVGIVNGGTSTGIIPDSAVAEIGLSSPSSSAAEQAIQLIKSIKSYDPDVTVQIETQLGNRPGYDRTPAIDGLFAHAHGLAAELGFELIGVNGPIGGDANFAAQYAPTLDGMGPDGEGAHSLSEQIVISSLVPRARLLLNLFRTLG
ncbi:carboxypeptidase (plasmid) [Mesorhizobium sp. L-2-11]|nr:carboxypeptidase [Mesorhizobium sp. L-2-11]